LSPTENVILNIRWKCQISTFLVFELCILKTIIQSAGFVSKFRFSLIFFLVFPVSKKSTICFHFATRNHTKSCKSKHFTAPKGDDRQKKNTHHCMTIHSSLRSKSITNKRYLYYKNNFVSMYIDENLKLICRIGTNYSNTIYID